MGLSIFDTSSGLTTNEMVDAIEKKLGDNQWLSGQAPGAADREEFEKINKTPNPNSHPNAFAWYCLVGKFSDAARGAWAGGAAGGKAGGDDAKGKGGKKDKGGKKGKKEEPKKEDEVDEDDLFGSDDGADAEAAKKELEKKAAG